MLKYILKNKELRKVFKNFFSLSVLKVFNLILPFITLPYLIKTLGITEYGVIAVALSFSMYFEAITGYGFNLSATREIALHRHSIKQLSLIYHRVIMSKLLLLIFSLFLWGIIVFLVPRFYEYKEIFMLMTLYLIGQTFFPDWFFRGMEEMLYITILDIIIKGSFTILVFMFIHTTNDAWLYPIIYGSGFIIVSLIAHLIIITKFNIQPVAIKFIQIKKTLIRGFPLFTNQLLPNLYNNTTGFLVGIILGNYSAGVFSAVRQLTNLLSVFNAVVTTVAFPFLSRNKAAFPVYRTYYLIIYGILSILFLLLLPILLSFIGIEDPNAKILSILFIIGLIGMAIYSVFSTNYLLIHKKDKIVMRITIATSFVGFCTSFIFIYAFGIIGAASNIAFIQISMALITYLYYKNMQPHHEQEKK